MNLETKRLLLIPADITLADSVAAYYLRNRDFLRIYEPQREEEFFTAAHQATLLAADAQAATEQRGYRFYIAPKSQPQLIIGSIALSNVVWGAFRSCHLGYKLDKDFLNAGLMTEAVEAIERFAFHTLQLHRIEANVMPQNAPSVRVLQKCGYENEGFSKKYLCINGKWEDHIHMVKLNEEME
ncbi:MAG: GNAT family N-acetyltransferase [Firmicutes bacterium]|nr:GNAT family N-acetyltransferase [Bacillota bacterium]